MEIGSLKVQVVKKDIKNIHLAVYPPKGSVRLSSPRNVNDETIRLYLVSRIGWIRKQQRKFEKQDREPRRDYVPRESHYFLGQRYLLRLEEKNAPPLITLTNKYLTLQVRPVTSAEQREKILNAWYRKQLKQLIPPLIEKWERILDVSVEDWGIRHMKTKWGTCKIEAKRIRLNLELAKKPIQCLEFIIVHEMVHLLERKHNEIFFAYMNRYLPKWKMYRQELNSLPMGKGLT